MSKGTQICMAKDDRMKYLLISLFFVVMTGCASIIQPDSQLYVIDQGRIPQPDINLSIPGLGPCINSSNQHLRLNSQEPVIVLVHGCVGSAGNFRALAEVFAFSGQQAICFSYNDRDSLMVSSAQLASSLKTLSGLIKNRNITVIGHSQGGLIARKALVADSANMLKSIDADLKLVTVSSPFSGIEAASHCGSTLATIMSLGLTIPICKIASGDKWFEITGASEFIRKPGIFLEQVGGHLKINTNESDSCRRVDQEGECAETDYVFSLNEQRHQPVDSGAIVKNVEVKAGHVEIVGDNRVVPLKLIAILQQHRIMKSTEPEQFAAFGQMLTRLYHTEPPADFR